MFVRIYLIALPVFVLIDAIWLWAAKGLYSSQIGFLMKTNINWAAAVVFYLLFIVGLVVFVISPALEKDSWLQALLFGALFGLVAYATYDLTNLATVKNWPILITAVDLAWGATVAALVSVTSYLIADKLGL